MKYCAIFEFPLLVEVRSANLHPDIRECRTVLSSRRNVMKSASRAINGMDAMQNAAQLSYFDD